MGKVNENKKLLCILKEKLESEENISCEELSQALDISPEKVVALLQTLDVDVIDEDIVNDKELSLTDKKKLVLLSISKEKSLEDISKELNISILEVSGILNELRNEGYNIFHFIKDNENYVINMGNDSVNKRSTYKLEVPKDFTFLAISDTRLCSYYEQLRILNELYLKAHDDYNASFVLHCGDISEGLYGNLAYKDTIFKHDTQGQADFIVDNYPYIEGMNTYFITGEHDDTHIKASKTNIGKIISSQRDDMIYLGQNRCIVSANKTNILMRHPRGKVAYTISYKSQRYIQAMRSEDKVHILLNGHWAYMDDYVRRTIHEFAVPSVVAQTPEMDAMDTPNTVGAIIINVKTDDKNNFKSLTFTRLPYYKTYEEDYRRIKPLYVTSDGKKVLSKKRGI